MNTKRDSAHQSQNEDNFATFPLGLEFLNEAEKEKKIGKMQNVLHLDKLSAKRGRNAIMGQ